MLLGWWWLWGVGITVGAWQGGESIWTPVESAPRFLSQKISVSVRFNSLTYISAKRSCESGKLHGSGYNTWVLRADSWPAELANILFASKIHFSSKLIGNFLVSWIVVLSGRLWFSSHHLVMRKRWQVLASGKSEVFGYDFIITFWRKRHIIEEKQIYLSTHSFVWSFPRTEVSEEEAISLSNFN